MTTLYLELFQNSKFSHAQNILFIYNIQSDLFLQIV